MASQGEEVFASLQAVRVPAQVAPGAQFDVYIRKTQRGVQVASKTPLWRASGSMPVSHGRVVVSTNGKRHQQRPSAAQRGAAGAAGRARVVSVADPAPVTVWASQQEMPFEAREEAVGWLPGPVGGIGGRASPAFTGGKPGPINPRLSASSGARRIMAEVQFSHAYMARACVLARQHCHAWEKSHARDGVQRAFSPARLEPSHFELWIAARLRVAGLSMSVPSRLLWDPRSRLYDAQLDAASMI